jgi:hypothetical protein
MALHLLPHSPMLQLQCPPLELRLASQDDTRERGEVLARGVGKSATCRTLLLPLVQQPLLLPLLQLLVPPLPARLLLCAAPLTV